MSGALTTRLRMYRRGFYESEQPEGGFACGVRTADGHCFAKWSDTAEDARRGLREYFEFDPCDLYAEALLILDEAAP